MISIVLHSAQTTLICCHLMWKFAENFIYFARWTHNFGLLLTFQTKIYVWFHDAPALNTNLANIMKEKKREETNQFFIRNHIIKPMNINLRKEVRINNKIYENRRIWWQSSWDELSRCVSCYGTLPLKSKVMMYVITHARQQRNTSLMGIRIMSALI